MPDYIDYPVVVDIFVKPKNEEYPEDKTQTAQNLEHMSDGLVLLQSELNYDQEKIDSEDEENNYYTLRNNTHNDSKLLIILTLGSLISLGILANSILA